MALPEAELHRLHDLLGVLCRERTGESVRLEYHARGDRVTLVESRPLFIDPDVWHNVSVAQFEFTQGLQVWTQY
jgi:hypothetical protein